jgi:transposase
MGARELRVNVDVGCRLHSVAVGLSSGELLEEFDIAHRPSGFAEFFRRIETHRRRHGLPVAVAMEGYNGYARPLDHMVQSHDYQLYNVNNLKLARFKEIFPAAAKSDRIDARKGLELFQLQEVLPLAKRVLQPVPRAPTENELLKRLTRRRRMLVEEKTRVLSRLQADLHAVSPGLLAITKDADNLWFLHLLTHSDDLRKLARLKPKTLLKIPAIGRTYAARIRQWQAEALFSHEVDDVGPMIIEDARRVLALRAQINALER